MGEFYLVHSLAEALKRVAQGAKPIAGGTDLMVQMTTSPKDFDLVDLLKIKELKDLEVIGQDLHIGAAVTYKAIGEDLIIKTQFPTLHAVSHLIGTSAIQSRATIGGNIANASPACDVAPVLLSLGATIEIATEHGPRTVPYEYFHKGYKKTALAQGEILKSVIIPLPDGPESCRTYFRKVATREQQAITKVSLAASCRKEQGSLVDIKLAFASVGPMPLRAKQTETLLLTRGASVSCLGEAWHTLAQDITPQDDMRSTRAYRLQVAHNLLHECLVGWQS